MQTWLTIGEFCKLVHLKEDIVQRFIEEGKVIAKEESGQLLVEVSASTNALIPNGANVVVEENHLVGSNFIEKTIGTILNLHEKVMDAKDETLTHLKGENEFLKEALYSMQDLYEQDRKTIDALTEQLKRANEEIEFLKRKYKLMWGKAIENSAK
ncbi:MAG: DUF3972 domain-containing protein [Campylobacterales bacterium]|nr:DUF3972 domain-containing protein [Campylobacterales bacterium]